MNKQELEELVNQAFALYNNALLEVDRKIVLRAWYELLQDLPYGGVKQALLNHAAVSQYRPTPGDLRRAYINSQNKVGNPPPALVAWTTLIRQIKLANSGLAINEEVHPCIAQTLEMLGETAYQLHSTTDQINFVKAYDQIVSEYQIQKFGITQKETQA